MFRIRSVALAAALQGLAGVVDAASGCHPAWVGGNQYSEGDFVSRTKTTETLSEESCTTGADCVDGKKTVTTITTETHNYKCKVAGWCGQNGYDPIGIYSGQAWDMESGQCSGTVTASSANIPVEWNGGGCPKSYAGGSDYSAGALVSVAKTGYNMVYQCAGEPNNLFCGMSGYEPGNSVYWEIAWSSLGSCNGTMTPTASPNYVSITDVGGCPAEFDSGADYDEGDRVSKDGLVYTCKSWPSSARCSQQGYEPGTSGACSGHACVEYWKDAWTVTGYCSGTIAPTTAPNFSSLVDVGGCPDDWSVQSYEEGDRVHSMGLVYECRQWPFSGHCGQAGYEPNVNSATTDAWKRAWILKGHCSGSRGPTGAPSFDPANSVGACPDEWSAGSNTKYEEGDLVSVSVSTTPIRKVAYRCKAWPYSGHCGQYSPTVFGGDQGWTFAGSCDGSTGPTASPVFVSLTTDSSGCPAEWSASTTDYEAGDRVSYSVSSDPIRKILYKCRDWPNTGYCNQGAGFEPSTQYGSMAWTLMGACDGSIAPTAAPVVYSGPCEYNKCTTTRVSCTPGESGCSCSSGTPATSSCKKDLTTCEDVSVNTWSNNVDYTTGDVVRVGTKRFRCREWPNYLWCRMSSYKPVLTSSNIWQQAWRTDGDCPPAR
eukprot:CAMPEP_0172527200 /NCGR_PEP_ID=MMETSP1067-20121228/1937_1 /TAXON_ID=265564 ORGANISM="Thalassiosira punctigera, Strain Tpunct2005C2" /NCGR_SAMPLE_ID=MMETSP1067 /ASSEMBLY_ACC=CAM_ASM_000444 /LENGTH=652 /DNA_ID=CAMNT_0013310885 /DNA_START=110 /DNA_END=2068 /DNA_ORIENTATION=-